LVELTAAMTIFGFGVMGAMELFMVSTQATTTSLYYTQAVYLAEGILEETIANEPLLAGTDNGSFSSKYPGHRWTTAIEETRRLGLYTVTATVTWTEKGKEKEFVLTTLVSERS
jgi:Tfp pilus assembly protein PilV